jgi:hypothetical protein
VCTSITTYDFDSTNIPELGNGALSLCGHLSDPSRLSTDDIEGLVNTYPFYWSSTATIPECVAAFSLVSNGAARNATHLTPTHHNMMNGDHFPLCKLVFPPQLPASAVVVVIFKSYPLVLMDNSDV